MKKKMLGMLVCSMLAGAILTGCGSAKEAVDKDNGKAESTDMGAKSEGAYSIGYTVQDLSNPIWADTAEEAKKIAKEKGWKITVLDCDANAATQISQMENFMQEDVDAIIINPADETALSDAMQSAMDKGIKVLSYDIATDHADAQYLVDNYKLGLMIGEEAAKWINDKLGGEAEVGVLDYPLIPDIIARADGIKEAIADHAPKAKIVAQASAASAADGMEQTENFLQANPNIKVMACIGDGGAIGANEAVKASGKNSDNFGIFSADATEEALSKIASKESIRMTVQLDTPKGKATDLMGCVEKMLKGEAFEPVIYTSQIPINTENLSEYYKK